MAQSVGCNSLSTAHFSCAYGLKGETCTPSITSLFRSFSRIAIFSWVFWFLFSVRPTFTRPPKIQKGKKKTHTKKPEPFHWLVTRENNMSLPSSTELALLVFRFLGGKKNLSSLLEHRGNKSLLLLSHAYTHTRTRACAHEAAGNVDTPERARAHTHTHARTDGEDSSSGR